MGSLLARIKGERCACMADPLTVSGSFTAAQPECHTNQGTYAPYWLPCSCLSTHRRHTKSQKRWQRANLLPWTHSKS